MIVPWHDERTRTGAFVILPADELLSANINKKRRQCELPMTTDFDAPLRTQTIITEKVYWCSSGNRKPPLLAVFARSWPLSWSPQLCFVCVFYFATGWGVRRMHVPSIKDQSDQSGYLTDQLEIWDPPAESSERSWTLQVGSKVSFPFRSSAIKVRAKRPIDSGTRGHPCSANAKNLSSPQRIWTSWRN